MNPERLARFKAEMAAALVLNVVALAFVYGPGLPFHPRLAWVIWASLGLHLAALACFDAACKDGGRALSFFSLANIAIMVPALHYTGGAASPFVIVLTAILVSRAAYGIRVRHEIPAAAAYLGVVAAEALGLVEPWPLTARELYASVPALVLVGCNVLSAILCAGLFYRDIFGWLTESLSAEQAAKSAALRELARLDPAVQQSVVVSKLAHDINGRLTALSGTIRELERERAELPPGAAESLGDLESSLGAVKELTERIRNYADLRQQTPARADLWRILHGVLRTARHLPDLDAVDLLLDPAEPPRPVEVLAYPRELERAYLNIVKNAAEALAGMSDERRVTVSVHAVDGHAVVSVADNGPGMPAELLARVLKGRVSTKPQGSGLGLLIAREVCDLHRGRLAVSCDPGGGTNVTTTIPLAPKEAVPA